MKALTKLSLRGKDINGVRSLVFSYWCIGYWGSMSIEQAASRIENGELRIENESEKCKVKSEHSKPDNLSVAKKVGWVKMENVE
jgi:hypothetical protein